MSDATLEARVAALEQKLDHIEQTLSPPVKRDWRSTIGMFAGDALMKEIDEEGRKVRESDRKEVGCDPA